MKKITTNTMTILASGMLAALALPAVAQDHSGHGMQEETEQTTTKPSAMADHSMDDAEAASAQDHSGHGDMQAAPMEKSAAGSAHDGHGQNKKASSVQAPTEPIEPIPAVTEADRAIAFEPVKQLHLHGDSIHSYWLADQLEIWDSDEGTSLGWDATAWIGTDLNRAWLRSEGEALDGNVEAGNIELLYGHSVARWWDVVAGIRRDFGDAPSQDFLAFGVQGLAPYKYEFQATAYIGESGQGAVNVEAEYDTLLTSRLILQWSAEMNLYAKDDRRRGIGQGLSSTEAGVRLRYEIDRQFAPYVGVSWERQYGNTADFNRTNGADTNALNWVAGIRFWF